MAALFKPGVLTTDGKALLAKWQAGGDWFRQLHQDRGRLNQNVPQSGKAPRRYQFRSRRRRHSEPSLRVQQ